MKSRFFPTTLAEQVTGLFLCCIVTGLVWATEPNLSETPEDKAKAAKDDGKTGKKKK